MQSVNKFWGVMPAAGIGSRMQVNKPKQYIEIEGKTILQCSLEQLLNMPQMSGVQLCIAEDDSYWETLGFNHPLLLPTTIGGATRADSVLAGLNSLKGQAQPDDWVLVHDAARPFIDEASLQRLVSELSDHPVGGILAIPVADTLKQCDAEGNIIATIPRDHVWRAQTPQMFRFQVLLDALNFANEHGKTVSDESSAVEAIGKTPKVVLGDASNLKVTYPGDVVT